jgi:hypothetical protein
MATSLPRTSPERDFRLHEPLDAIEGVPDRTGFPEVSPTAVRLGLAATSAAAGALLAWGGAGLLGQEQVARGGLLALALAGGLLSTWSPCGYSSLSLLRPKGRYGLRSVAGWLPTLATHGLGYAVGALVLGGALGLLGTVLPVAGITGGAALALGLLGVLYGLHQLDLVNVPYPQRKAQVPHDARQRFPMWVIGLIYGLALGLAYLTYVQTPILYLVTGAAVLSGSVGEALLLFAAFNLGRFLPMLVNALPVHDWNVQRWLADRQERAATVDGMLLTGAGAGLLVLAAA